MLTNSILLLLVHDSCPAIMTKCRSYPIQLLNPLLAYGGVRRLYSENWLTNYFTIVAHYTTGYIDKKYTLLACLRSKHFLSLKCLVAMIHVDHYNSVELSDLIIISWLTCVLPHGRFQAIQIFKSFLLK